MKLWQKLNIQNDERIVKKYKLCGITLLRKEKSPFKKSWNFLGIKVCRKYHPIDVSVIKQNKIYRINETINNGITILTSPHCMYIAETLKTKLKEIDIDSDIITEEPGDGYGTNLHIVICANYFSSLPKNYIIYQLEQKNSNWFTKEYIQKLNNSIAIFDYSLQNIAFLRNKISLPNKIYYMPLSYTNKPLDCKNQQYDVLFYGDSSSTRRKNILNALSEKFQVKIINNLFGDELKKELAKAKIIINIHYYENALLETTRLCEALTYSNAIIISEKTEDMNEYPELMKTVDFVELDDLKELEEKISFYLNKNEHTERLQEIVKFKQLPTIFNYYFYRFWLAHDIITFDKFYELAGQSLTLQDDFWCLSLPESRSRRESFDKDNKYNIRYFPALRNKIGWIGCGMSYKFMLRKAKEMNLPLVQICEDDVQFPKDFTNKLNRIKTYLTINNEKWDVFSGLIADVSNDTEINKIDMSEYGEYIYIDRLTSTVFNIYNNSFFGALEDWDPSNRDTSNTIDRYIENKCITSVVTTYPFLVNQKEELNSTLWGTDRSNNVYTDMIERSKQRLKEKIAFYYLKDMCKNIRNMQISCNLSPKKDIGKT